MDILTDCLPELRYLLSLSKAQSRKYLNKASPKLIECLFQVALNLVYASKEGNGLTLLPHHISPLKKHRSTLLKLVKSRQISHRRKLLKKGGSATALLTVLASVIASLASML